MDRTSRIGLFVCLVLLIALEFIFPAPPMKPKPAATASTPATTAATVPPAHMTAVPGSPAATPTASTAPVEKLTVLENDAMKVTFTSLGAAITEIELKLQKADNGGNIILNEQSHSNILALSGWPGADTADFQAETIPNGVRYTCDLPNGVNWQRTYTFGKAPEKDAGMSGYLRVLFHKIARRLGQPETKPLVYTLDVSDTLTNKGGVDVTLPDYSLSVGRAEPIFDPITEWSKTRTASTFNQQYLGSGWLASKFHLTTINDFNPGYIPLIGIKTHDAKDEFSSKTIDASTLRWIGVENQFANASARAGDAAADCQGVLWRVERYSVAGAYVPDGARRTE